MKPSVMRHVHCPIMLGTSRCAIMCLNLNYLNRLKNYGSFISSRTTCKMGKFQMQLGNAVAINLICDLPNSCKTLLLQKRVCPQRYYMG